VDLTGLKPRRLRQQPRRLVKPRALQERIKLAGAPQILRDRSSEFGILDQSRVRPMIT
jgi:hypothetical protein